MYKIIFPKTKENTILSRSGTKFNHPYNLYDANNQITNITSYLSLSEQSKNIYYYIVEVSRDDGSMTTLIKDAINLAETDLKHKLPNLKMILQENSKLSSEEAPKFLQAIDYLLTQFDEIKESKLNLNYEEPEQVVEVDIHKTEEPEEFNKALVNDQSSIIENEKDAEEPDQTIVQSAPSGNSLEHSKDLKSVKSSSKRKKWTIGLVSLLALLFFMGGGWFYVNQQGWFHPLTVEEYIATEDYDLALKHHPDEFERIEREIFLGGHENIPKLKSFISHYPDYHQAKLDLAYLEGSYQDVINLAEYADTDARKAQLVVSFLETDQIPEAKRINDELNNENLALLIEEAYQEKLSLLLPNRSFSEANNLAKEMGDQKMVTILASIKQQEDKLSELFSKKEPTDEEKEEIDKLETSLNHLYREIGVEYSPNTLESSNPDTQSDNSSSHDIA